MNKLLFPPNLLVGLLAATAVVASPGLGVAQGVDPTPATNAPTIAAVDVVGAGAASARQVAAWSGLDAGKPYSPEAVANGVRRLFATQKFADIFVYRQNTPEGIKLIINLREFPRIRQITFRGNDKIKKDDLSAAFPPTVGQFANPVVIARDLEKLRELYYDKGYYNVLVHTDSSRTDSGNHQELVITVVEGRKVKVRSITFEGNEQLTDEQLRGAMKQKTSGFLRGGTFKKAQFEGDRENIVNYCRDKGYRDANVADVALDFAADREHVDIVMRVYEGPRYTVGDINWTENTVFDDASIAEKMTMTKGSVFSEGDYQRMLASLHSLYYDSGHIFATIEPTLNIQEQTVNLSFRFREGQPARIRSIDVADNVKTYDRVVLRELSIFPGEVFSQSKIQRTQRDIFQLGYFEDVAPDTRLAGEEDVDLIFRVKEKQTGQFSFGMAYSAQTSATGFIQLAENNFRGKGQTVQLAWQFGSRRRYLDLGFTEPWFMGTPTSVGADVFDRFQYNFDDFYESRVRGFSLRLSRRVPGARYTRAGMRYELSSTRLSSFSSAYVQYLDRLEQQIGTQQLPFERLDRVAWPRTKSAVTFSLTRNSTDNPFFPTAGSRADYSVELSGGILGGEIDYTKHLLRHSYFQKMPGRFALNLRTHVGLIHGLRDADRVPDYEKFRLGGNRFFPLRGYGDLEVVPRGNPSFIGGRFYLTQTTELLYPLTRAIQLLAFLDQGDAWNSLSEADLTNLRKGAGFGVRVEIPMMGTIGFDYGYGFDRTGGPAWEPHFNFGTFF